MSIKEEKRIKEDEIGRIEEKYEKRGSKIV